MSGAINTVGKIMNSTAGRVVTGVATGGLSEAGRAASGVARLARTFSLIGLITARGVAAGAANTCHVVNS